MIGATASRVAWLVAMTAIGCCAAAAEDPARSSTMGIGRSYLESGPPTKPPATPAVPSPGLDQQEDLPPDAPAPSQVPGDFEGVWKPDFTAPLVDSALGTSGSLVTIERTLPPYSAEGANKFWHRVMMEQRGTPVANTPSLYLPSIPLNAMNLFLSPMTILQNRQDFVIFFEAGAMWRIHLGAEHPRDLKPTFQGHSVGRWEGATLVVDSRGFGTRTWLDSVGSPHGKDLRFITRITKIDAGRKLEFLTTFDDPAHYTRPFTVRHTASWRPDLRMLEVEVENMRPENNTNLVIED
jgi:hypothetical protein